jgi:hypothetical protein
MAGFNMGSFFAVPGAPNWNANNSALGKELYPNQKELSPGEWGFNDPNQVKALDNEWAADWQKAAQQMEQTFRRKSFGMGGGSWGGWGGSNSWGGPSSGAWGDLNGF